MTHPRTFLSCLAALVMTVSVGCPQPEPDDAIVGVDELRERPGHPCTKLLPKRKKAQYLDYEPAIRCTKEHCLQRVRAMDPEADTQQLHHFCLDGFPDTDASLTDCRLAACEHLLPEMPGLVYKMNTTGFALTSRQDWSGPISESSALLAEILAAGEHARCEEVVFLAAVLYTMEVDGEPIPWDLDSARAALGLARWHDQSCPGAKARFAEVLHFVPGDILERVQREEAAAE